MYSFNPTKSKLLPRGSRLYRADGWTTNGFWVIMSSFEPDFIAELKDTNEAPEIKKFIDKQEKEKLWKLKKTGLLSCAGKDLYELLHSDEGNFYVWVNVYFLGMFEKLSLSTQLWGSGQRNAVIVKTVGDKPALMGAVMPSTMSTNDYVKELPEDKDGE